MHDSIHKSASIYTASRSAWFAVLALFVLGGCGYSLLERPDIDPPGLLELTELSESEIETKGNSGYLNDTAAPTRLSPGTAGQLPPPSARQLARSGNNCIPTTLHGPPHSRIITA